MLFFAKLQLFLEKTPRCKDTHYILYKLQNFYKKTA